MIQKQTIAIDGSAASGKSTLGNALAKQLNYLYLDTGVMYRSATWAVLHYGVDINDVEAVSALAENFHLELLPPTEDDGRQYTVKVDGHDITWRIRQPEIDANVAIVSSYPRVRKAMTKRQRALAEQGPIVMVGRDIGTVVLPQADLKIFIEASPEVRAQRRYQESLERGDVVDYDALLKGIIQRDKLDREKPISPMIPADDAVIIKTDAVSAEQVLEQVLDLVMAERVTS